MKSMRDSRLPIGVECTFEGELPLECIVNQPLPSESYKSVCWDCPLNKNSYFCKRARRYRKETKK